MSDGAVHNFRDDEVVALSLFEIYWRALRYLAADKRRVAFICGANVVLAIVTIAEPILFGRIIDAISDKTDLVPTLALWAGLGAFNIVAFVLVARGADRIAHARRAGVLCDSFERVITMPLVVAPRARHVQRAAHAAARRRRAVLAVAGIHAPASVHRRGAGAAGADRDFARPAHVDGAGGARRRSTSRSAAWSCARPSAGQKSGRTPLPQGLRPCDRLGQQRRRAAELQPHRP